VDAALRLRGELLPEQRDRRLGALEPRGQGVDRDAGRVGALGRGVGARLRAPERGRRYDSETADERAGVAREREEGEPGGHGGQ
jgi:hypothetical protein